DLCRPRLSGVKTGQGPEIFDQHSSHPVFAVILIGAVESVHKQENSEGHCILRRNSLFGYKKNKGCTEYEIQYNHYYSEDLTDSV
ncbi:MAG TPA: hypothetical protein VFM90_11830, partial [Cyclobacteriaceae bacterium]|nr:hypothetical protein [Cyclobacteriaceae bacterium]